MRAVGIWQGSIAGNSIDQWLKMAGEEMLGGGMKQAQEGRDKIAILQEHSSHCMMFKIMFPVFKMVCNITISSLLWRISVEGEGTQTWMSSK
jgi:hypothetical protein